MRRAHRQSVGGSEANAVGLGPLMPHPPIGCHVEASRDLRIGIASADYLRVSGQETIEGSLKIGTAGDGFVAIFSPYVLDEHWPPGQPLRLPNREAVARFLQDIGTQTGRIIEILDDLRGAGAAFMPMVFLTATQRQRFQL